MGSERGILSRSLEMILTETKKAKDSRVLLSFFEIYNEKVTQIPLRSTTFTIRAQPPSTSGSRVTAKCPSPIC